jgi:hypothetical protein
MPERPAGGPEWSTADATSRLGTPRGADYSFRMESAWTYKRLETAFARLYGADETAQTGPFRGRVKHLQRLGVPMARRPGRGSKALYDIDETMQFLFCFELSCFGVDPTLAVAALEMHWDRPGPGDATLSSFMRRCFEAGEDAEVPTHLAFSAMGVARGWNPADLGGLATYEVIETADVLDRVRAAGRSHSPRLILMNVRGAAGELRTHLAA